jgi:hypothetical protein
MYNYDRRFLPSAILPDLAEMPYRGNPEDDEVEYPDYFKKIMPHQPRVVLEVLGQDELISKIQKKKSVQGTRLFVRLQWNPRVHKEKGCQLDKIIKRFTSFVVTEAQYKSLGQNYYEWNITATMAHLDSEYILTMNFFTAKKLPYSMYIIPHTHTNMCSTFKLSKQCNRAQEPIRAMDFDRITEVLDQEWYYGRLLPRLRNVKKEEWGLTCNQKRRQVGFTSEMNKHIMELSIGKSRFYACRRVSFYLNDIDSIHLVSCIVVGYRLERLEFNDFKIVLYGLVCDDYEMTRYGPAGLDQFMVLSFNCYFIGNRPYYLSENVIVQRYKLSQNTSIKISRTI